MFKTKIKLLTIALVLASQSLAPVVLAGYLNARAYGANTVAGYASLLKTSMITPGKDVIFVVEKPDYSVVRIPAKADLEGIAKADLYGHQTKLAGEYRVAINYPGTADASPQNTFVVYPDQVSATQSNVGSTTQMVEADGLSNAFVTVTLYDAYRNPIPNHRVSLISSRRDDVVEAIEGGVTNKDGRASFKLTSRYSGVSVMTAMDASANVILQDREEIVFYAPKPKTNGFGGNAFTSNMLQADLLEAAQSQDVIAGPVASFDIEGLSSSVKVNTDLTMTVIARDKDGNVAKNYTGTILISTPDDENAVLPNNGEYTFKEADQGQFTFNLALRFSQVGNQFLQILDKNDWKIAGEKEVEVIPAQSVITPSANGALQIKAPADGAEFGSNAVIISGNGAPNINLKVFDDDVKIADTETDSDGFFSYQVSSLSGGFHTFYVMGSNGEVSESVTVNIDTIPPALNNFQILPEGVVKPGQNLTIVVNSEPNLEEVKIRLQGIEKELLPEAGQFGSYVANIGAPALPGTYPVDVILVDGLSNRAELMNQKAVLVQQEAATAPGSVQNLQGISGNGEVLLTWDKVTGHTSDITGYKVYYGTDFESLTQMLQTTGPDSMLKISGLQNDNQYFFTVTAIDSKGIESQEKSVIIAVTPSLGEAEPIDINGELLPSATEEPTQNHGSLYNNQLTGTAGANAITLYWQPFPGINPAGYKLYFGLNPGQYDDYVVVPGNQTTYTLQDLINNVTYYFAVVALDGMGNEVSPMSAQYAGMPAGSGFQSLPASEVIPSNPTYVSPLANIMLAKIPAQQQTGAEAIWIVGLSVVISTVLYIKRRRLRSNLG